MIVTEKFFIYLLIMAGITYLIRMLPLTLIKKKIKNRFILSFLYYIPYTVLSVMTIPAIFTATPSIYSALSGLLVALFLSYKEKKPADGCGCIMCGGICCRISTYTYIKNGGV